MHQPSVQHTLFVFGRLLDDMPPLVPQEIQSDMQQAYEQMRHNYSLSLQELEDTIIVFGKKLWPYRKAYDEFLDIYEGKLGEQFLLGRLPLAMKKRYQEFKAVGGHFRDFHHGAPAMFFTSEERTKLCEALVETNLDIRRHAIQSVLSIDQEYYQKRVIEFQTILEDIEKRLDTLRLMADDEQEHPELAGEIREQVRSFEYGLCLLEPAHTYEAVCKSEEHFQGRKLDKKHHRV